MPAHLHHREVFVLIVRDRRDGHAVSWGTDHHRMREIAATSTDFELWPDLGAGLYYRHIEREGMRWVHPYDLDAAEHAEIKP